MKIEINNLTALIQGRDLNLYQRSLAVEEWHKLLNHVDEMEQALSLCAVVGRSEQLPTDIEVGKMVSDLANLADDEMER
jgi:hypothetical protein